MTERLKNSILCSFLLSRRSFIGLIVLEALLTFIMVIAADMGNNYGIFFGNDIPVLIFMFTYGMSFYERHTPFCISNAVSMKYRIISQSIAAGVMCLTTAVYDCVSRSLIMDVKVFSTAEIIRTAVCGNFFREGFIPASIAECFTFYVMFFAFGYFLGAVKYVRSGGFMLGVTAAAAAMLASASIIGRFTWINPVAWIFGIIPAFMLHNCLTASLLYGIAAAAFMYFAYRFSFSGKFGKTEAE